MHLHRRALEKAATARDEERVSREDARHLARRRDEISNRTKSVPRDVERVDLERAQRERLPRLEKARLSGYAPLVGYVSQDGAHVEACRNLFVAADVIVVMVSAPDGLERDIGLGHEPDHGAGLRGIDERSLLRLLANDEIRIVVREAWDRNDSHEHF
jgi:hypothetical protein